MHATELLMHLTPWPRAIRTPSHRLTRYTIMSCATAESASCEQDLGCRIVRMYGSLMLHRRYTILLRRALDSLPKSRILGSEDVRLYIMSWDGRWCSKDHSEIIPFEFEHIRSPCKNAYPPYFSPGHRSGFCGSLLHITYSGCCPCRIDT
jgi:hypothetical protein